MRLGRSNGESQKRATLSYLLAPLLLYYLRGIPSVSHADAVRSCLGLLCIGKSDFEAVAGVRRDDWFKAALSIRKVPSRESLRWRFVKNAAVLEPLVQSVFTESFLQAVEAPITAVSPGHVPLDR